MDNGEKPGSPIFAGRLIDVVSVEIKNPAGASIVNGGGSLSLGNLEVKAGDDPLTRDCSGC